MKHRSARPASPAALDPLLAHGLRQGWTPDLAAAVRRLRARAGRPEPPGLPPAPARRPSGAGAYR